MKDIYNLIKDKILEHDKVKHSVIGGNLSWKRSHFVILSEIIKDELADAEELQGEKKFELGTTISHITLQRFFENEYDEKTHNDLRFLRTLDKICIFLGYKDLNTFAQSINGKSHLFQKELDDQHYLEIVRMYCRANFEFFKKLPELHYYLFEHVLFGEAPFLGRIIRHSNDISKMRLQLYTENNRSNYEIFAIEILEKTPENIVIKTQEFWNLLFIREGINDEYIVNELTNQVYFLKKIGNEWRIWDNYNPNAGFLNRK